MTRPERDDQPTQKTQPKKGKPAEIPVPTREEWLRNMEKVAPPERRGDESDEQEVRPTSGGGKAGEPGARSAARSTSC